MTRLIGVALLVTVLAAGCGAAPRPSTTGLRFEEVSAADAREMPPAVGQREGRPGPDGGTILVATSALIDAGVPYRFSLGHCGLFSPVDVDGAFWDAIDGVSSSGGAVDLDSDGEMINATPGVIVVIGDEARFRTESGSVIRFRRHDGEKEFPGCD